MTTLLSYACIPASVPVSQAAGAVVYADLLISLTNGGFDPVVVQAVGFALPTGQDVGSLTNQVGTITADVPNDPAWSISGDGAGTFTAKPASPVTLQPKAGVNVRLRGIVVSTLPGLAVINVAELSAPVGQPMAGQQGTLEVTKAQTGLAITSFAAAPVSVQADQPCTLSWSASGADHCVLSWDGQSISDPSASGNHTVNPHLATTYTLTAVGGGGSTSQQLLVPVPVQVALQAPAAPVAIGGLATLSWTVKGAMTATLSPVEAGQDPVVPATGSRDVHPTTTTTYTLTAGSPNGGVATATATVDVQQLPVIRGFNVGQASFMEYSLSWDTANGTAVTIEIDDRGQGAAQPVAASGSMAVREGPLTKTATLRCTNLNGTVTSTVYLPGDLVGAALAEAPEAR